MLLGTASFWQAMQDAGFGWSVHRLEIRLACFQKVAGWRDGLRIPQSTCAIKAWGRVLSVILLLQVFMAVLLRGYAYTPEDVQEPFTTWPVGGKPVNGLPLHLKRL